MEKTLILLKPDTIQRSLVGQVISRLEAKGLKINALKMIQMNPDLISEHYAHIADKPFFPAIVSYMSLGPIVAMIVEGEGAVASVRSMCGATNPAQAAPGTIRGDFSLTVNYNIIHASDSNETAEIEIKRFFKPEEIFDYKKVSDEIL